MLIPATQLRVGMLINYQNELYRIMAVTHITPGNWRGMVQTKMRGVRSGTQTENRFRSEDKVDRVTLDQQQMEFLYADGDEFHFMNTESFEQVSQDAISRNLRTPNGRGREQERAWARSRLPNVERPLHRAETRGELAEALHRNPH
jgi:translation elongation factor P/translation initiation factor 5A